MNNYYYDKIADDYHQKRKYQWRPLESYFENILLQKKDFQGINLDIGCANGRNFKLFKNESNVLVGIDNSFEFLKIAIENLHDISIYPKNMTQHIHLVLANMLNLPIRPHFVNNIFSIAAIHHLESRNERKRAISQMTIILKKNGHLLITVWRKYQKKYKNFFISDKIKRVLSPCYSKMQKEKGLKFHGDKFVPWIISKKSETHVRFYHFFSKRELKKLLSCFEIIDLSIMGGSFGKDNFFVLTRS